MFKSDVLLKPSTPKKVDLITAAINMTRARKMRSLCPSLETEERSLNARKATPIVKIPILYNIVTTDKYIKYKIVHFALHIRLVWSLNYICSLCLFQC